MPPSKKKAHDEYTADHHRCPNGAYKTREQHPEVPLTAADLTQTAKECLDCGASMIHMHVRKPDGRHLLDAHAYLEATAAVRKAVGQELVVQVTTEAAQVYQPHEQMRVARETAPEAISVGLREILKPEVPEADIHSFFTWLKQSNVMTQIILYDVADVQAWQRLRASGVIPENKWFLLLYWAVTLPVRPLRPSICCLS